MNKKSLLLLCVLFLSGCTAPQKELDTAMDLRSKLLKASSVTFETNILADYGDITHSFSMSCSVSPSGSLSFSITQPDSINGISGTLCGDGGEFIFDQTALCFPLLAEEQLSPVSAPWVVMNSLRSGYLAAAGTENGCLHITIDDSFQNKSLRTDIWFDTQLLPEYADILYDGKRILSLHVTNFTIL